MACTQEQALKIILDLHSTKTIAAVLKENGVDTKSFFHLVNTVPSITEMYTRVRALRADLMADAVLEVSRSDLNERNPNAARNQMNALTWLASKLKPELYGERIDLNVTQQVDIRGALEEAKSRIRDVIAIRTTASIESHKAIESTATGSKPVLDGSTDKIDLEDLLE